MVGVTRLVGMALALAVAIAHQAQAAAAPRCPKSTPAIAFPGPALGSFYSQVKGRLPRSAACENPNEETCLIADAAGYTYWFSMREAFQGRGVDRMLFKIELKPDARAAPPFGVKWGESPSAVGPKVRAATGHWDLYLHQKDKGHDQAFAFGGCFVGRPNVDPFSMTFEFRDGRLIRIEQGVPYS